MNNAFFSPSARQRYLAATLLVSGLLFSSRLLIPPIMLAQPSQTATNENYAAYVQQANDSINRGNLTEAIQLLEKAMPLAPDISIAVVQNNLAAVYMKRGNFLHNTQKQDVAALNDFRKALYLLDYGWPEGLERKPLHEGNLKIARDNLRIGYTNLKLNPKETALHLKLAKELRLQGKFQEAIVEYAQATELDGTQTDSLKALGDLFTVLNKPDKAKKYYTRAVKNGGGKNKDDLLAQLASAQNKSGEVNTAIDSLNKALEINPGNLSALNQLEQIWRTELKYNPSNVVAHANLASVFQKMKRFEPAINEYTIAEQLASKDPKVSLDTKKLIRLNLGTLFQETKKFDQAINAYDTVLQIEPKNQLATLYKATAYRDAGNSEQATRWYLNLLSLNPDNTEAHQDLLEMVLKQGTPDKVAAGLQAYANKFPSNALVQSKVGEELHKLKRYDEAVSYYQRAIQINPNMAGTYANLGAALQAEGKDDEALQALQKAAQLDPKNDTVQKLAQDTQNVAGYKQFQKAVELQQAGKTQESLPYFEKALTSDPSNEEILSAYGIALQSAGQIDAAIRQYQKLLTLSPNTANYHYYLATAFHQKQQIPQALSEYRKAVSLDATGQGEAQKAIVALEQAEAANKLEKVVDAYNKKQYPQALLLIDQVVKADPKNANAYYYQGLILNEQNKPDAAIQSYRKAIGYNGSFGDAYYALGILLDTKKDTAGAKMAFQKFVDLSAGTDDDFVKYARERLKTL